jgi:hypothetical protein
MKSGQDEHLCGKMHGLGQICNNPIVKVFNQNVIQKFGKEQKTLTLRTFETLITDKKFN